MASEPEPQLKRSAEDGVSAASVMLLDIEGTTTSISFVKVSCFLISVFHLYFHSLVALIDQTHFYEL